ncbi:polyprenyl synthetase family protein [Anaerolentibacter hominis]|uniref:polyprenyl synthetase family protein n=1 Tax=Anaerolentibacter hominis TaxID=3079009 RepID=UPI0031B87DF4
MDFKRELERRTEKVNDLLRTYIPEDLSYQSQIGEAMEYSLMAGGKRLRPVLMLETYRTLGGEREDELKPFMAAVEMIHTYSLVHDDLPAMDNDEYRRGKKTTHAVYGEAMGILAGDALLNFAFETVIEGILKASDRNRAAAAAGILAKKAGIYGMIGGQVVDVQSEGEDLTEDKLTFIYRLKTSALIEASMMAGAVMAGTDQDDLHIVEEIAGKVGLAFQIQDDILDVTGSQEELGKPIYSDEKNHKTTYVTLEGTRRAGALVEQYSMEALNKLMELERRHEENEFLEQLIRFLIDRRK